MIVSMGIVERSLEAEQRNDLKTAQALKHIMNTKELEQLIILRNDYKEEEGFAGWDDRS